MNAAEPSPPQNIHTDGAIKTCAQDELGRGRFARSLAAQVKGAPHATSFVMGLVGPWGSGKTSILNMLEEVVSQDKSVIFLWFNPWLFSGHQQLVAHFFQEMAAQLRDSGRLDSRDIWRGFEGYSRILRSLRSVQDLDDTERNQTRDPSLRRQRLLLDSALRQGGKRLVIVIDDLDRLEDDEIRDVMKLVRIIADFPNVTYILSYDQKRLEEALGKDNPGRGRAYLEKIVQIVHHMPRISSSKLTKILLRDLEFTLQGLTFLPFEKSYWQDLFFLAINPLFHDLRDVRRYLNSIRPTIEQIGDEITLPDILAMEALRILEPTFFSNLVKHPEILTEKKKRSNTKAEFDRTFQELLSLAGARAENCEKVLERVFPLLSDRYSVSDWQSTWRKSRRMAHPDVFRIYIERILPEAEIPTHAVLEFISNINDEKALTSQFAGIDSTQLRNLLERIEDYENEFKIADDGAVVRILIEQLPRLPKQSTDMFDFGPEIAVGRVILRLLRNLSPQRRFEIISRQLSIISNISAKALLVNLAISQKLVNESEANMLSKQLTQQIINTADEELASQDSLMGLLNIVRDNDEISGNEKIRHFAENDAWLLCMLASDLSKITALPLGSISASTEYGFSNWETLEFILSPDTLHRRIHLINGKREQMHLDDRLGLALDTALKYVNGWRPPSHGRFASHARAQAEESMTVVDLDEQPDEQPLASGSEE